jgi:hypothetical protein
MPNFKYWLWALVVCVLVVSVPFIPVVEAGIQSFAIVPAGGTGRTSLTTHDVLIGNGTSAVTLVAPSTSGFCLASNGASADPSFQVCPASNQLHSITFVINGGGSTIATGDIHQYPTADFGCTINRIDTSGNPSGSITVDIWKAAGAIPTSGNKISASAPATLSSAQLAQSGSISGWTTSVSVGDVFDASVATVTSVTSVTVQIWCQ